jgi:GntR family transcriptional regulator
MDADGGFVLKTRSMKSAGMLKSSAEAPAFQPLYRQIKLLITQSLVSGEWGPGDPLPSEIELAGRYSVSQGTVRKAMSELADENLLIRFQGKGTFVASHAEERSKFHFLRLTPDRGELKELSAELLEFGRLRADAAAAKLLRLPAGGGLCLIRRVMMLSDRPVVYEEVRLPARRFKGLSAAVIQRHECMLYSMYESGFGVRILHADERLKAVAAPREAASALGVAAGASVLLIERVAYTYTEEPAELRRTWCDTREHHYRNRIMG